MLRCYIAYIYTALLLINSSLHWSGRALPPSSLVRKLQSRSTLHHPNTRCYKVYYYSLRVIPESASTRLWYMHLSPLTCELESNYQVSVRTTTHINTTPAFARYLCLFYTFIYIHTRIHTYVCTVRGECVHCIVRYAGVWCHPPNQHNWSGSSSLLNYTMSTTASYSLMLIFSSTSICTRYSRRCNGLWYPVYCYERNMCHYCLHFVQKICLLRQVDLCASFTF